MAFYGSLGEVDYDLINATINKTATNIFVYDTSKDSDGGAWRYRTTEKSWYNETLNTATRGSRKEFPAVAVIVAETSKVTIYDGDDPDLPMWMIFQLNAYSTGANLAGMPNGIGYNNNGLISLHNVSCAKMLNGELFIGGNTAVHAAWSANFISEKMHEYLIYPENATRTSKWELIGNISQRNLGEFSTSWPTSRYKTGGSIDGVKGLVFDVDMKVLPNAPIDELTGLATPTIAVATKNGVSVIRDDGSVVDLLTEQAAAYDDIRRFYRVSFDDSGRLAWNSSQHTNAYENLVVTKLTPDKYSNFSATYSKAPDSYSFEWNGPVYTNTTLNNGTSIGNWAEWNNTRFTNNPNFTKKNLVIETNNKLVLVDKQNLYNDILSIAHITTSYNTGWMYGPNVRGVFLCDKTPGTISYSTDLLSGIGSFDSTAGWNSIDPNWTISGGVATSNGTNGYIIKSGVLTTGKQYVVEVTISNYTSGTLYIYGGAGAPAANNYYIGLSDNGTFKRIVNSYNSSLGLYSGSFNGTIDNVRVYEAEQDRSVQYRGLQVFGSITKTAVVNGADLVSYSGFSDTGNYLEQHYYSGSALGDTDFTISFWMYTNRPNGNTYGDIVSWGDIPNSVGVASAIRYLFFQVWANTTSGGAPRMGIYYKTSTGSNNLGFVDIPKNTWHQHTLVRKNGVVYHYINTRQVSTNTAGGTFAPPSDNENYVWRVGWQGTNYDYPAAYEQISLLKIIKSALPESDIVKIFNEEKFLFQSDAKCTLDGTSDSIVNTNYDVDTDTLHVGTSSGRSDFQGLRRINNTTTAVTTAISASNGLIVEQ